MTRPKLVKAAVITAAHGVRGEVKLHSLTDNPRDIEKYCPLYSADGSRAFTLKITGGHDDQLIARIEGITDRNEAELLRRHELYVDASLLPSVADDKQFYAHQLIGLQVLDENGETLGKITDVAEYGAGPVIDIQLISGEMTMLPFTTAFFPKIDQAKGCVTARLPQED